VETRRTAANVERLRRVMRRGRNLCPNPNRPRPRKEKESRRNQKRGEPQDRLRGATNPQDARRRKPSRWWETTKAERDLSPGKDRPKRGGAEARAEASPSRSGRRAPRPMEGHLWKPHERRQERSWQGRKESVSRRGLRVVGGAASAARPGKRSFSQPPKKARKDDGEANPPYPAPHRL
jgi:hypothetical protein